MKKSFFMKKSSTLAVIFFTIAAIFSSCSNFANAGKVSQDIKAAIEYNNASSYTIRIDSDKNRGVVKSPAGGEAQKKVTDEFTVAFEPLPDYEFMTWKIIDSKTKTEYQNGEYLQLASTSSETTTCKFVKAPPADVQLTLFAVVGKKPKVIAHSPQRSDAGAYRDSRICVMFDSDIEEKSIYYDINEINSLKQNLNLNDSDFLNAGDSTNPKIYGYISDGKQYYKNIKVVDQKTRESLLSYFGAPYFEDSATLVIPPEKNPLEGNTNISVTLDMSFSSNESGKSISLKEDYQWLYFVNSTTDGDAPAVTEKIKTTKMDNTSKDISTTPGQYTLIYGHKLQLSINVTDYGAGPSKKFKLRLSNSSTKYEFLINYEKVTETMATFGYGTDSLFKDFEIPNVPDGEYKLNLLYYDNNDNTNDPKPGESSSNLKDYYIRLDYTKPEVTPVLQAIDDSNDTTKTALKMTSSSWPNDIVQILVKYRKFATTDSWQEETFTNTNSLLLNDLIYGTKYEVNAYFYDEAENVHRSNSSAWTKLDKAKGLDVADKETDVDDKAIAHLSWTKPYGDFDSYTIKYQEGSGTVLSIDNISKNKVTYDVTGLSPEKNYSFWVTTVQNSNNNAPNGLDSDSTSATMPMHRYKIFSTGIDYDSSTTPYLSVRTNTLNLDSSSYETYLYFSKNSFDENNLVDTYCIKMNKSSIWGWGGGISFSTGYSETEQNGIPPTKIADNLYFKFGETYYFKLKTVKVSGTEEVDSVWSEPVTFRISHTVTPPEMDYITGTKCKVFWSYPSVLKGKRDVTTNLYLIDSNSNRTLLKTWTYVPSEDQPKYYYLIENLTRNTDYTVEVELIYNNVSASQFLDIKTKNIALLTGFAKNSVSPYTNNNNNYYEIKFEWDYPSNGITANVYIIQVKLENQTKFGIAYYDSNDDYDEYYMALAFTQDGLKYENGRWNYDPWYTNASATKLKNLNYLDKRFYYNNYNNPMNDGRFASGIYYDFLITGYRYDSATGSVVEVFSDCMVYKYGN